MKEFKFEERVYNYLVKNAKADTQKTTDAIEAFIVQLPKKNRDELLKTLNHFKDDAEVGVDSGLLK